jgi:hypothetical protein
MSKRKPARASKRGGPKIAAKAQRANQAVIKSPIDKGRRPIAPVSIESSPQRHSDTNHQATLVDNSATAIQDNRDQTVTEEGARRGIDLATANVWSYQAKMQEIAEANLQLVFEFTHRLATMRSPLEMLSVISEFTSKRIATFQKYSKEMLISRR